jgi:hypothetical protein
MAMAAAVVVVMAMAMAAAARCVVLHARPCAIRGSRGIRGRPSPARAACSLAEKLRERPWRRLLALRTARPLCGCYRWQIGESVQTGPVATTRQGPSP